MKPWSLLVFLPLVGACHQSQRAEGPFERAGKGLDNAAQKTGTALEGAAKKTGEATQTAVSATGKAFKKLGAKLDGSGSAAPEAKADAGPEATHPK